MAHSDCWLLARRHLKWLDRAIPRRPTATVPSPLEERIEDQLWAFACLGRSFV